MNKSECFERHESFACTAVLVEIAWFAIELPRRVDKLKVILTVQLDDLHLA